MSSKSKSKNAPKGKTDKSAPMPAIDLKNIVDAGPGGMFVPPAIAEPLQAEGLVEINLGIKNEAGEVACRATEKGIAKANEVGTVEPANDKAEAPKVETTFKIEAGVPVPPPVGRGRSGSKYPFDLLEVGQSFFVPDTAEQPDAAATLASTVSGATQRYATDHPTETKVVKGKTVPKKIYSRKFCLRKVDAATDPSGMSGARVWRVEVSGTAE